ncbi:MAG: FHA domain-containing protein [Hyphomicrobiaceae bacterium]
MKHPTRETAKPIDRRGAADDATIIIGADDAQETMLAPAVAPNAIVSDSGHTRILRPTGAENVDANINPVVGWLVVLAGPGKGNFRAIYSGSNTIGRSRSQRIAIDFGDDAISSENQAFLVYEGRKRQYQLVPNLERPNLVHVNDTAVLSNVELKPHDRLTIGSTTLLFVPLCGPAFDWSDMA